ncbi:MULTISPECIES: GIY-YIG nuclease family protein [unclassified Pseudoalteromonas]|uniref:GIY-YIG nuclease family protein n=1 Tax=unclassified Pseudoalteromonas TaxID=194690 RepID=UPI000C089D41|nr:MULTISPECIES: GIY-YIG nuclease family protein [unclassified Pseudoalteromonas]MDP2636440.1 GIY-YIG nuclease family protein [Pseudoalteromonas sp. 1_MG-2023]PHN90858.1 hypothetical protein CSC79_04265 [Pseudoalteromonas sp. 3D05]
MTIKSDKSLASEKNTSKEPEAIWSLYIVQTRLGHWYTGISTDVAKRFATHQAGKGAKNLKGKGPLTLVFQVVVGNRSEATKLEYRVKQLTKPQKRAFIKTQELPLKVSKV